MEALHKIFSCFSICVFFHFSSLFYPSSSYEIPDRYFINCGSSSTLPVNARNFAGDKSPVGFSLSSGDSRPVENRNSSAIGELYQTARIFKKDSSYELDIDQNGTYVVRFHFFPFSALGNLSETLFDVLASGFSLLSNFTLENSSLDSNDSFPHIQEFLINIPLGKFKIDFVPSEKHSFAFINAIEVFLAPPGFIPDSAPRASLDAKEGPYNGLLKQPLRVVHRINIGGQKLTPDNDTLLRNWIPDDNYLLIKNSARNSKFYDPKPKYQNGGATEYDAPDFVYKTAKELNIDNRTTHNFNMTWCFDVLKGADHLVRVHFCDIVSPTTNEFLKFTLYINSKFRQEIYPWDVLPQPAVPFYRDFVVASDDSGFVNISIGSPNPNTMAFLNGVEIMELITTSGSASHSKPKNLPIIIGSVVGGVILVVLIILTILLFALRKRKWKWNPVEALDWTLPYVHGGGSSYSRTTNRTLNGSHQATLLNLGLKIPFAEILHATRKFDTKLMIGEGGFGKVYKGTLRNGTRVAVKRSQPGLDQGLTEFQTEVMILSKIRYQHLVSLIGYCDERDEMILVYEFMEKGTLRENLYISPQKEKEPLSSKKSTSRSKLKWDERLRICIGAAKGIHYLHTGSTWTIIHRDIKSTNILLDEHYVAKVADFGLSRSGPLEQTHMSTEVKGSFGYLDPEYFRCLQLTQKSDVYSFGVVLLEALCGRPVIDQKLPRDQVNLADWGLSWQRKGQIEEIVDPSLVGGINPDSLRKFGETVEKCLQENGADRPNMVDVLWDLEYCLQLQQSALPKEPYEDSAADSSAWGLPLPVVQRLPSNSVRVDEDDLVDESMGFSNDVSQVNAGEVFSQLRIDEAR